MSPLFLVGFRPFFTLAFAAGVVLPLSWVLIFAGTIHLPAQARSPVQWHAHEMDRRGSPCREGWTGGRSVSTLGPIDLLLTKLSRGDALDLEDIRWLIQRERLESAQIHAALNRAIVPKVLAETFAASRTRLEAMLQQETREC